MNRCQCKAYGEPIQVQQNRSVQIWPGKERVASEWFTLPVLPQITYTNSGNNAFNIIILPLGGVMVGPGVTDIRNIYAKQAEGQLVQLYIYCPSKDCQGSALIH